MDDQSKKNTLENEAEIVENAKTDDKSFEILYNFYFSQIYGYLYKRTGSHETTEDLVSTTFMKIFCNLKNYHSKGATFRAWMYKIATNNLIDYYRKTGKRKEVDIENIKEPSSQGSMEPEKYAESEENRVLVQEVLKDMPERYQNILYLKFFGELSNIEIAQTIGISANNAGVIIHRALNNFQKTYKKYEQ